MNHHPSFGRFEKNHNSGSAGYSGRFDQDFDFDKNRSKSNDVGGRKREDPNKIYSRFEDITNNYKD